MFSDGDRVVTGQLERRQLDSPSNGGICVNRLVTDVSSNKTVFAPASVFQIFGNLIPRMSSKVAPERRRRLTIKTGWFYFDHISLQLVPPHQTPLFVKPMGEPQLNSWLSDVGWRFGGAGVAIMAGNGPASPPPVERPAPAPTS